MIVDEDAAPTIRAVFRYYIDEGSLAGAADRLTREGFNTPNGANWCCASVRRILTNDVYTGRFTIGKRSTGKYHYTGENGPVKAKKGEGIPPMTIEDHHPALVSKELFEQCAALLKKRKRFTSRKAVRTYIFSGLLRCAKCGGQMVGCSPGRTPKNQYVCSNYRLNGRNVCECFTVHEEPMERFFLNMIRERFTNPDQLDQLAAAIRKSAKERRQNSPKRNEGDGLRRRLAKLDKDIDKGAERLLAAPDAIVATLTDKLAAWQDQRAEIKARLEEIENEEPDTARPVDEVVSTAMGTLKTLEKDLSTKSRSVLQSKFRELIDRIEVVCERTPICPGGQKCRTIVKKAIVHLAPGFCIPVVAHGLSRDLRLTPPGRGSGRGL